MADKSIKAIREALAAAVKRELGTGYQVNAYAASDPRPPFVQVTAPAIEPDQAFQGGAEWWEFHLEAGIAGNLDQPSQERADEFIESGKLQNAIIADRTLGGACDGLVISRIEPRYWQQPTPLVGWEFTVRVFV